jgi:hypothetical protein
MARIAGATVVQGTDLDFRGSYGWGVRCRNLEKTWKKPGLIMISEKTWRSLKKSMVRTVIWKKPGLISED